ncbi:PAS domain S-box protein [uncultured Desulfobulbus sp.]|uniref:hybrid sensor histidine kinase/response regulator n=1 Tax=uncultured Desulfobulbus sp. TaxID=239745 RepID=UPI0029C6753A|nr:PAS domain S-box protein [uncultured Desulfobulbus sp.]
MTDTPIANQLASPDTDLHRQIALLEKKLHQEEAIRQTLQDSEKRYRRLFESARDGILILDAETGKVVDVNPFLVQLLGFSYDELCGQFIWELGVFKDIAASQEAFKTLQENEYIRYEDLPLETRAGLPIAVEFVSNVYLVDHGKVIQCNIRDITARKRADAERKRLQAAIKQAGEGIVVTDVKGNIEFVNPAFEQMTGYSHNEILGRNPRILKSGKHDELFYHELWETISSGRTWAGRLVNKRKDGNLYSEETTISPVLDASGHIVNYVAVKRDITEQLRLAAQFQQAQKMEAVGLLAGGVAHDYNNMLSVILGYAELALEKVAPGEPLHTDLEIIITAAKRSAAITRQLLAFARKQTIVPVVLDLNKTVESMLDMLRRLIGEDIDLAWLPKANLGSIKMDPTQVDQILANLCVNARDAVTGIGKITIETRNAVFDAAYCADHFGFVEGAYALLAVSDDGCGMNKEVLDHIFDPFFTTKGEGQGTGLGLSTVYGIVKQNNGFINVYSEPGKGTTIKIYLPQHLDNAVITWQSKALDIPLGQGETVLVVEDEPALLMMAQTMLRKLGYQVLAAGTPGAAIELAKEHESEIHLLLTDVVMPEMNGRDLAEWLQTLYPGMKILFMSGYTAEVIAHRGVLKAGVNFIQKPFATKDLAIKIREVLQEH